MKMFCSEIDHQTLVDFGGTSSDDIYLFSIKLGKIVVNYSIDLRH